jgi:Glycosyl transferase family 2
VNPRYQILIPTIPHRNVKLRTLLAALDYQMVSGVRVLACRDNLQLTLPQKNQKLQDAATGDYVSWIDDDDMYAPDYLRLVMQALEKDPDMVGFQVRWTIDGVRQLPVDHSLKYDGWQLHEDGQLVRDITCLNPIRRELARLTRWEYLPHGTDGHWAYLLRQTGAVRKEEYIPQEMYYYQYSNADSFQQSRNPMPEFIVPPVPQYEWLDWLT